MSFEIALIAGIMGAVFLFAYLSFKLEDNMKALKMFFILLSFLFVLIGMGVIRAIAQDNYSTGIFDLVDTMYMGYLYVYVFLVFFFVIMFVLDVLSMFMEKKRAKNEDS